MNMWAINSPLRDECLNMHWFDSLPDSRGPRGSAQDHLTRVDCTRKLKEKEPA
jgi:hypothetical protein